MTPSSSDDGHARQTTGPAAGLVVTSRHHGPLLSLIEASDTVRVDLARTLFTQYLPKRTVQRLQVMDRVGLAWFVRLFWASQCLVTVLAFIDTTHSPILGLVVPISSVAFAVPALGLATGSLSLKLLCLLQKESECFCTLTLTTFQWIAVALAFRDARALVCVLEWCVVQLAFAVDADFRLYTRRLHPSAASIVVVLAYWSSSMTGMLRNSFKTITTINGQTISANDILQWVSPPLLLLLLKSMYHQHRLNARRITPEGSKTVVVYGSILRIRLMLVDAEAAAQLDRTPRPGSPLGIPILRSNLTVAFIDPAATLCRTACPLPDKGMGGVRLAVLYAIGMVSYVAACYGAIASQVRVSTADWSPNSTSICIAALLGAVGFCGTSARYYNRGLLRELLGSFDVAFSSLLFHSAALLLCSMYAWDLRCINVVSWWIWFHWILCFDALTPSVRQYFRLRKLMVTPIVLFTLYGLGGPLALLYGYTDVYLSDRELFAHIRVSTVVVSHVLTLWLFNMRLVWDFGVRDDGELLSITDLVQYAAPADVVFSRNARTNSRRSSVVSIAPSVRVDTFFSQSSLLSSPSSPSSPSSSPSPSHH